MNIDDKVQESVHQGYNVQRIREILGVKQDTLARSAGMSQQNVSKLEKDPIIPEETLQKLAKGLGVTPEFINNFNEEKAIYNIQTNNDDASPNNYYQATVHHTSDLEKVVELFKQLLQSEKEKVDLLTKTNKALEHLLNQTKSPE